MIKEIKYGSHTATPSDYECPDGDLAAAINLVPEDGTIKPVMPPTALYQLPEFAAVVAFHHTTNYRHYIVHYTASGNKLYWFDDTAPSATTLPVDVTISGDPIIDLGTATLHQVTAVGNTLVVLTSSGVEYILWNGTGYDALGQKPPRCELTFTLQSEMMAYPGTTNNNVDKPLTLNRGIKTSEVPMPTYLSTAAWLPPRPFVNPLTGFTDFDFSLENKSGDNGTAGVSQEVDRITSFALAGVNKFIANENKKGRFVFPFFVRYAYELYDGSLIMHSYPVLMIPNSRGPVFAMNGSTDGSDGHNPGFELEEQESGAKLSYTFRGRVYGFASKLTYTGSVDSLTKWKDIIRGVNIYVTPPIYTYDQAGKVYGWRNMDGNSTTTTPDYSAWESYYTIGAVQTGNTSVHKKHDFVTAFTASMGSYFEKYSGWGGTMPSYILTVPEKSEADIRDQLTSEGKFYKVHTLKIDDIVGGVSLGYHEVDIKDGVLQSLVARATMADDYNTNDRLICDNAFVFNSRLNLGGVERVPHSPLKPTIQWPLFATSDTAKTWQVAVKIKDNGNTLTLLSPSVSIAGLDKPRYIYYPNMRAFEAIVTNGTTTYKVPLTEHPNLNGAYWCFDLWTDSSPDTTGEAFPSATPSPIIEEYSKVYHSEVNNPFFFPVLDIHTVGAGRIMGVCSAVKPLAQDQFGKAPLYAFTDEGVWALDTASDGTYSSVWPITRDVCTNPNSITQLDAEVLFATKRGIMMLSGTTSQCITDWLDSEKAFDIATLPSGNNLVALSEVNGENNPALEFVPFQQFLDGCKITYDYTNQRIVFYNPDIRYAYVYSLEAKKWGMMMSDLVDTINAYPDALAYTADKKVVDLSHVDPAISAIPALLITRPIKLDMPDDLKTVDTVLQRGVFDFNDATREVKPLRSVLYGSRDLYNWHMVYSSTDHRLRGFRGTPYKYYRIALLCELKPGESVYGCTVQFTPRYNNQPR